MKYIKANGIFFQNDGSGLFQIVTDRNALQQLYNNSLPYKAQNNLSGTVLAPIDSFVDTTIESVVSSGKTINPGLTDEDIAAIDVKNFMKQAEASVKDEYKQKFLVGKNSLVENLKNIDYDFAKTISGIERTVKETKLTGTEDLASRGLAFSSGRQQFETDLADAEIRSREAASETARRSALEFGTTAEGLLGTKEIRGLNLPRVAGQRYDSFTKGGSLVGSLNTEKKFAEESIAKELARQEAERRSYATRSLSFQ